MENDLTKILEGDSARIAEINQEIDKLTKRKTKITEQKNKTPDENEKKNLQDKWNAIHDESKKLKKERELLQRRAKIIAKIQVPLKENEAEYATLVSELNDTLDELVETKNGIQRRNTQPI